MAGVRQDRGAMVPGSALGRRSIALLVMALVAVFAVILLVRNASRRSAHQAPASIENVEPAAAPPAAEPTPLPAVSPAPTDERAAVDRNQASITRAIEAGRPGLTACYQRALVRDESLAHGKVMVRVSIAASGRVNTVNVVGPEAFHAMQPCLQAAISKWDFPAAREPYAAEFPLALQASQ
jgi:outer membrane biosynthesis protein TonB